MNDPNPRVLNTTLPSSQGLTEMGMGGGQENLSTAPCL